MTDKPADGTVMVGETGVMSWTVQDVSVRPNPNSVQASVVVIYSKPLTRTW